MKSIEAAVTGKLDILFYNILFPLSLFVSAKQWSRRKPLLFDFKGLTSECGNQV